MMGVSLEATWPRAFVALAGCLEGYVAGRGFVPDLLRYAALGVFRVLTNILKPTLFSLSLGKGVCFATVDDVASCYSQYYSQEQACSGEGELSSESCIFCTD